MAEQSREAGAEAEAGSRQEEGDKEAEPSMERGEKSVSVLKWTGRIILPWREKGKVRTFVDLCFSTSLTIC